MDLGYVLAKSQHRLTGLHPIVTVKAKQLIELAHAEGINIIIVQGLRTMVQQAALYAQGRTKPGAIVTHAKAGESFHNYGLAIDYALLADDGYSVLWTVNDKWRKVAEIGKSLGFVWGGDWTGFRDYPHLEMSFGLSIDDLLSGRRPVEGVNEVKFKDIEGHWAEKCIDIVSDRGFMTGFEDETFKPDEPVSRGQLAKVLNDLLYFIEHR